MTNRDRNLIGQDAYSQIKALLLELWSYPESSRFEINAQNFIQQRTGLSRSRIMQVLSELKAGDYIKILHRVRNWTAVQYCIRIFIEFIVDIRRIAACLSTEQKEAHTE